MAKTRGMEADGQSAELDIWNGNQSKMKFEQPGQDLIT
jgi:hypothetical protein